ncbi:LuxR family transcriptional regulator (plasmid) [Sphingomonas paeninsulae]|uniref:LuxR family transcriptional regulator n=1 Tax=Sphingomonas paeninsulae TaxID=2319844 RepID=A0A494TIH7_SPHPE|nr:autoinducer binding domain-containing protein [Sphingomonas paeninsulae]AYJ84955.1 LuxR family transcriptional regulator [Sphingomonas paeninsulae]
MCAQNSSLQFIAAFEAARTLDELRDILAKACIAGGYRYFALTQHADFRKAGSKFVRLHNYPDDYTFWFDALGLGTRDPVHRASQLRTAGFRWSAVPGLIDMTATDEDVFAQARRCGIGEGFTVPANVLGELSGSISFAMACGNVLDDAAVQFARLVCGEAFECVRRILLMRPIRRRARITARQLACLIWSGKGKTDGDTATIMEISRNTVLGHMRALRDYFGSSSRVFVVVQALRDGTISFSDIFGT